MARPRTAVLAVAALTTTSLLAAVPAMAAAHTTRSGCPKAESLVPGAHLHAHKLAKGVSLASGTGHDSQGSVVIHVLRVKLGVRHVHVKPLVHSLAERSPLSQLAAHRHHLVAATNTGYFDFRTGAPVGPFISHGLPVMLSTRHQQVAGIGSNGLAEGGDVWLSASLTAGSSPRAVSAINELDPPSGLAIYTPAWGSHVSVGRSAQTRPVVGGAVGALSGAASGGGGHGGHAGGRSDDTAIPAHGRLLVATSRGAEAWLEALHVGASVTSKAAVATTAARAFSQAYGVGSEIVAEAGHPVTGFSCDSANTRTPARTSIGYANGGHQLVLVTVNDHPGTSTHGLDEDQMSKLMVQLRVSRAYAFDGSGSTELLARKRGTASLTRRTYPADGEERAMPMGLGIFGQH